MGSEKMSKSLGNVQLIRDLQKNCDGEIIRLALIKASHRNELVWTSDLLFEADNQLDGWYRSLLKIGDYEIGQPAPEFLKAIVDDLNTPKALFVLSELGRSFNYTYEEPFDYKKHAGEFVASANLLGLLQKDPEEWFKGGASVDEEAEFDAIALRRQEARAAKDWAAADAARDEATAKGIVLEDGPDGTTWRKA